MWTGLFLLLIFFLAGLFLLNYICLRSVTEIFLRPILQSRHEINAMRSNGSVGQLNTLSADAYRDISHTRWLSLIGVGIAVISSTLLYFDLLIWAVFASLPGPPPAAFAANGLLNPFVMMINVDSVFNDIGMALVADLFSSWSPPRMKNAVTPKSSLPPSVTIARSQLAALNNVPQSLACEV